MIVLIGGEKGGTGKSTVATNLAAIHAIVGKEVLLLDTDGQASAPTGRRCGMKKKGWSGCLA